MASDDLIRRINLIEILEEDDPDVPQPPDNAAEDSRARGWGGIENLKMEEIPTPKPSIGEALIRVLAAGEGSELEDGRDTYPEAFYWGGPYSRARGWGGIENLKMEEIPTPKPSIGEALIRVLAAGEGSELEDGRDTYPEAFYWGGPYSRARGWGGIENLKMEEIPTPKPSIGEALIRVLAAGEGSELEDGRDTYPEAFYWGGPYSRARGWGGIENLKMEEIPTPKPSIGEALIRVLAAGEGSELEDGRDTYPEAFYWGGPYSRARGWGGIENLKMEEIPTPKPSIGEALIRVLAAGEGSELEDGRDTYPEAFYWGGPYSRARGWGGIENLKMEEIPTPKPSIGEALIRVLAAGEGSELEDGRDTYPEAFYWGGPYSRARGWGGIENLKMEEIPTPKPSIGEALIRVLAAEEGSRT
eukprot:CAMPEP_0114272234 /NCGR_PEP_ID=MMETSP0058-20121206/28336_1 /TAXON_ID=36894 /ORGANISM="Pyramimonas parkeae, CCMP726" /LENGTH=415 /DNA_ID=CAMNT_0001391371 /DNA_START=54 /DNA_END=1307 /DNA_ORIENTATION=-